MLHVHAMTKIKGGGCFIKTSLMTVKRRKMGFFGLTKKDLRGYYFVGALVLGLVVFNFYPITKAFFLSLQNTNGISPGTWVGTQNYKRVLSDELFWGAIYNTVYMGLLSVVMDVCASFILASLINSVIWGKNIFKSIFFLSNVVSVVAASILFSFLFYPTEQGVINSFLGLFGIAPLGWFSDPQTSRLSICIMGLWRSVGYNTIIFLAGLQSVPRELYESADVDGVNNLEKWWYITIPSVKPIFVFVIMINTISSMRRFSDVWMVGGTGGNPSGTLVTAVLYIYRNAFTGQQMGIACAAAYVLFLIILVLTIINNKVFNRRNDE